MSGTDGAGDGCALCGGTLQQEELPEERIEQIKERNPALDADSVNATSCTGCGHVSFYPS